MKSFKSYLSIKEKQYVFFLSWRIAIGVLVLILLHPCVGKSQLIDNFNYTEISVTLNVARLGSIDIPVVIHGPVAYLPVKEIFDFLRIRNIQSPGMDSISGFFINPKVTYLIDKTMNRIRYDDEIFQLKPGDIIRSETNMYIKEEYFRDVFGLDCAFNYRSLSITLTTKIELPAIREMQQEMMRRNISQFKGEKKADTTIKRSYLKFHLGMADWAVIARQQTNGKPNTGLNLNVGAVIAGGETNVALNYNSSEPFNLKQQYYTWKYVNNDHSFLRQVMAGKILVQSTSSIYTPVTGVQFTNTPTTYRKSFGIYRLNSTTEPGWMVELYVNSILINYTKADASGFFTFEVPLVYGNTTVKIRVYGPYGEERFREQTISIPFNFLPFQQFEYNLTAGLVNDEQKSRFLRATANYGLSKRITVGTGVEYLSSVASAKAMPFLNFSFRAGANLLISGEYIYGVRTKGILSYRLPANIQIDVNYTKFNPNQTAIKYTVREEKKLVISVPFHTSTFNAFSRLTINQITQIKTKYTTAEFLLSGVVAGVSTNLTTYAVFANPSQPFIYSNLSQTFRLPAGLRITPQVQYEYMRRNFSMIRCEIEKNIFNNGFLNFSYQKDIAIHSTTMGLGIRYNFSFAQTALYATLNNHTTSLIQSARGSLLYNSKTKYLGTHNQSGIGKGGVIIIPFLDMNGNGLHDANEPKAFGLNLHIAGGRIERNNKDTSIRILGLEAYNDYFIELDKNSFENIAWQVKKPTIRVTIDPNYLRMVEVPVSVMGEVSGNVSLEGEKGFAGIGRIIIQFYKKDSTFTARTLSEDDGYFSFLGFAPGTYTATIDTAQLRNLNFYCLTTPLIFTIKTSVEGAVSDGLEFKLKSQTIQSTHAPIIQKDKMALPKVDTGVASIPIIEQSLNRKGKDTIVQKTVRAKNPHTVILGGQKTVLNQSKRDSSVSDVSLSKKSLLIHPKKSLTRKYQIINDERRTFTIKQPESADIKMPVQKDAVRLLQRQSKQKSQEAKKSIKNEQKLIDSISKRLIKRTMHHSSINAIDLIHKQNKFYKSAKDQPVDEKQTALSEKLEIISQIQKFIIHEQYSIILKRGIYLLPLPIPSVINQNVRKKHQLHTINNQQRIIEAQERTIQKLDSFIKK